MKLPNRSVIPLVAMVFISMFMAFPIFPTAAATPLPVPTLEARQGGQVITEIVVPGKDVIVSIEIWATNVYEDWEITGFQFSVPFETEWLSPAFPVMHGFMDDFVNDDELLTIPNPYYFVVSDIPYEPNWFLTTAAVMIMPDPSGEYWPPFPSGEGRLLTLRYTGTGQGAGNHMPINIIDIMMILARDLNVELSGWKFKVNGKTGVGLGHRSTVGAVNTLEVQVSNTGTIDVYVRATFDIVSAMAVDSVSSDSVYLPVGQSTVLSATWTASVPGHYEITGIVSYPPFTILYPLPSTRTQTVRIDVKPH